MHLVELGLSMLFHSHVPLQYWVESFNTANYIANMLPSSALHGKSPHEMLLNNKPDYTMLKTFESACYPYLRPYTNLNLDPLNVSSLATAISTRAIVAYSLQLEKFTSPGTMSLMKKYYP